VMVSGNARPRTRMTAPAVIPVSLKLRRSKPKVVLTKATESRQPPQILMLLQSTGFDELGSPVFTLSVWRVTSGPDGRRHVEETFVVNSI
jgi:hypothetical protein